MSDPVIYFETSIEFFMIESIFVSVSIENVMTTQI